MAGRLVFLVFLVFLNKKKLKKLKKLNVQESSPVVLQRKLKKLNGWTFSFCAN